MARVANSTTVVSHKAPLGEKNNNKAYDFEINFDPPMSIPVSDMTFSINGTLDNDTVIDDSNNRLTLEWIPYWAMTPEFQSKKMREFDSVKKTLTRDQQTRIGPVASLANGYAPIGLIKEVESVDTPYTQDTIPQDAGFNFWLSGATNLVSWKINQPLIRNFLPAESRSQPGFKPYPSFAFQPIEHSIKPIWVSGETWRFNLNRANALYLIHPPTDMDLSGLNYTSSTGNTDGNTHTPQVQVKLGNVNEGIGNPKISETFPQGAYSVTGNNLTPNKNLTCAAEFVIKGNLLKSDVIAATLPPFFSEFKIPYGPSVTTTIRKGAIDPMSLPADSNPVWNPDMSSIAPIQITADTTNSKHSTRDDNLYTFPYGFVIPIDSYYAITPQYTSDHQISYTRTIGLMVPENDDATFPDGSGLTPENPFVFYFSNDYWSAFHYVQNRNSVAYDVSYPEGFTEISLINGENGGIYLTKKFQAQYEHCLFGGHVFLNIFAPFHDPDSWSDTPYDFMNSNAINGGNPWNYLPFVPRCSVPPRCALANPNIIIPPTSQANMSNTHVLDSSTSALQTPNVVNQSYGFNMLLQNIYPVPYTTHNRCRAGRLANDICLATASTDDGQVEINMANHGDAIWEKVGYNGAMLDIISRGTFNTPATAYSLDALIKGAAYPGQSYINTNLGFAGLDKNYHGTNQVTVHAILHSQYGSFDFGKSAPFSWDIFWWNRGRYPDGQVVSDKLEAVYNNDDIANLYYGKHELNAGETHNQRYFSTGRPAFAFTDKGCATGNPTGIYDELITVKETIIIPNGSYSVSQLAEAISLALQKPNENGESATYKLFDLQDPKRPVMFSSTDYADVDKNIFPRNTNHPNPWPSSKMGPKNRFLVITAGPGSVVYGGSPNFGVTVSNGLLTMQNTVSNYTPPSYPWSNVPGGSPAAFTGEGVSAHTTWDPFMMGDYQSNQYVEKSIMPFFGRLLDSLPENSGATTTVTQHQYTGIHGFLPGSMQSQACVNGYAYFNPYHRQYISGPTGFYIKSIGDNSDVEQKCLKTLGFKKSQFQTFKPELRYIRMLEGYIYDSTKSQWFFSQENFCVAMSSFLPLEFMGNAKAFDNVVFSNDEIGISLNRFIKNQTDPIQRPGTADGTFPAVEISSMALFYPYNGMFHAYIANYSHQRFTDFSINDNCYKNSGNAFSRTGGWIPSTDFLNYDTDPLPIWINPPYAHTYYSHIPTAHFLISEEDYVVRPTLNGDKKTYYERIYATDQADYLPFFIPSTPNDWDATTLADVRSHGTVNFYDESQQSWWEDNTWPGLFTENGGNPAKIPYWTIGGFGKQPIDRWSPLLSETSRTAKSDMSFSSNAMKAFAYSIRNTAPGLPSESYGYRAQSRPITVIENSANPVMTVGFYNVVPHPRSTFDEVVPSDVMGNFKYDTAYTLSSDQTKRNPTPVLMGSSRIVFDQPSPWCMNMDPLQSYKGVKGIPLYKDVVNNDNYEFYNTVKPVDVMAYIVNAKLISDNYDLSYPFSTSDNITSGSEYITSNSWKPPVLLKGNNTFTDPALLSATPLITKTLVADGVVEKFTDGFTLIRITLDNTILRCCHYLNGVQNFGLIACPISNLSDNDVLITITSPLTWEIHAGTYSRLRCEIFNSSGMPATNLVSSNLQAIFTPTGQLPADVQSYLGSSNLIQKTTGKQLANVSGSPAYPTPNMSGNSGNQKQSSTPKQRSNPIVQEQHGGTDQSTTSSNPIGKRPKLDPNAQSNGQNAAF